MPELANLHVATPAAKLYWVSDCGGYVVYMGDCRDVHTHILKYDCVVSDPPYGISHKCNFAERGRGNLAGCKDYKDVYDDDKPFDPTMWIGQPAVLWGGNWYADKLPASGGWLVWDKERPDTLDQATCELAWTNCVKGVRRFKHLWNGMMKASEHGEQVHPTQKPVALMEWVIGLSWLEPFKTIIDPYMGVGATGVACVNLGRKFVGVEIDETYCKVAVGRIQRAMMDRGLMRRPNVVDNSEVM